MQAIIRKQIRITGVVQGVGFRPFVYAAALRCSVGGFVANDSAGVVIEAEGGCAAVEEFLRVLREEPPALARIDSFEAASVQVIGDAVFAIHHSHSIAGENTPVPPDIATCDECRAELLDPANRRYRYPFINCTNCGPRYTIIEGLPYDRPLTTMAGFAMCAECEAEYRNPLDRRFHAQPIACPRCGPQLWLALAGVAPGKQIGDAALVETQRLLRAGAIVAIKGIGGFHLACDATNPAAVKELRRRKGRAGKPFAVMARDVEMARRYAEVNAEEERILTGREKPIVLLQRKHGEGLLADSVAPGQGQLGIFLPYSPLHVLLIGETPLVMTSGNRSDEPIAHVNDEALERLSGRAGLAALADAFLLHNRAIHTVCDDSVVRVHAGRELPIRRSRGYAPLPVLFPFRGATAFGAGAELKATFCLARGNRVYLSQHIGDMENLETQQSYKQAFELMRKLFHIEPEVVACDMHPGYLSTQWAVAFAKANRLPVITVQHHHAHAAALMAEHGLQEDARVLAVVFDGTGMGTDGAIWGGEIFAAGYREFERVAHLRYVPLPGGDSAIRRPYRTALSHLRAAGLSWDENLPCVQACSPNERRALERQLSLGVNSPLTSSMGRLFDGVASLIGVRHEVTYEAQGAMELEALASAARDSERYEFALVAEQGLVMDPAPVWRRVRDDLCSGVDVGAIALRFHRGVADMVAACCVKLRAETGLRVVGLTGGVFQNVLLVRLAAEVLRKEGFEVLTHSVVPPNDGGLALGQAAIALLRAAHSTE